MGSARPDIGPDQRHPQSSNREALTTPTALAAVRVVELKATLHHALFVDQLCADQIKVALLITEDLDPIGVPDIVVLLWDLYKLDKVG